jgi:putative transposase
VSRGVSPTERIRDEIDALFTGDRDLVEVLEEVARLGARLIIQAALEAEVTEFLGRARYQRAANAEDARPGSRNGYCPTTVRTTAGPVTLERPKLRGTTETFASRLFGAGVTKTNALESLVIAGVVRGLSVRDVEATSPTRSAPRRRCRSRRCRGCASRSRTSSRGGGNAASMIWRWTTCSWMRRTSRWTRERGPSRCWPPGDHHRGQVGIGRARRGW